MAKPAPTPPCERASAARLDQRERVVLAIATAIALALPGFSWLHLDRRIASDVAPALSRALGTEIEMGGLAAGATGEIVVSDLRIGEIATIPRIEVAVALSSLLSARPRIAAIAVDEPRVVVAHGGRSIRELASRARSMAKLEGAPSPVGKEPSAPAVAGRPAKAQRNATAAGLLETLTIRGGEVVVDLGPRGQVRFRGLSVAPTPGGASAVRIAAQAADVELRRGPYRARGRLSRAAADFDLTGPARFLALGGELEISAAGGIAARLSRVTARLGIDDPRLVIQGEIEGAGSHQRPGRLAARIDSRGEGVIVDADGERVPLALLAPLLPRSLDVRRARGTGALRVTLGPTFRAVGELAVGELTVDDRRVAGDAVSLSGRADLDVTLERAAREWRIGIAHLELQRGNLVARFAGEAIYDLESWTPGQASASWLPDRGALRAAIPEVDCASALHALPRAMRAELEGMDVGGVLSASAELRFDRANTAGTTLALDIDVDRCRVAREALHDPTRLLQPFEHRFPNGSQVVIGRGEKSYIPLSRLPDHVLGAFVASEDGSFYRHRGFDMRQIERSLAVNLRDSRFVRGGSTISQQLVKNAFLSHDRNLARKLQEAVLTWRLENHLSKREILERYLNIIQLGTRTFGVGQAAEHWFGKSAKQLSPRESAFLAALTPAPNTIAGRVTRSGRIEGDTLRRIESVLGAMRGHGVLSERAYRRAMRSKLVLRRELLAQSGAGSRAGEPAPPGH